MTENILVIDDDPAVRKAFKFALEDSGYEIDAAESGEAGLLQFQKKNYGLIFLDLKMPGINGAETLKRIREMDTQIPIYIVTAFHKEFLGDLQELRQQGIRFELLRKPLGSEEIVTLVSHVLEKE